MDNHFNRLSPAQAERLALLAEECGEVIQAVGKILRHGYSSRHPNGGPDNRATLERELGDVLLVFRLMLRAGDVNKVNVRQYRKAKAASCRPYLHHQE